MQSINKPQIAKQHAPIFRVEQKQAKSRRRKPSLDAFIQGSASGDIASYQAFVYLNSERVHSIIGCLHTTEERVWLHALALIFEWRDAEYPNARLFIHSLDEQPRQERRKAA